MPDEELKRFAVNEADKLSIDSFHALKAEFEARHLDIGIIQKVEFEKEIAEATKASEFERAIAEQFTETIWQFAFEEKAKGTSNVQIFKLLLQKNISEYYAYMLIESIESRAKELEDSFDTEIIFGWLLCIGGTLFILFNLKSGLSALLLIWGTVLLLGGVVRLATSYKNKNKFQIILKNIEAEKEIESSLYQ